MLFTRTETIELSKSGNATPVILRFTPAVRITIKLPCKLCVLRVEVTFLSAPVRDCIPVNSHNLAQRITLILKIPGERTRSKSDIKQERVEMQLSSFCFRSACPTNFRFGWTRSRDWQCPQHPPTPVTKSITPGRRTGPDPFWNFYILKDLIVNSIEIVYNLF
jgi:hypothetical protein